VFDNTGFRAESRAGRGADAQYFNNSESAQVSSAPTEFAPIGL